MRAFIIAIAAATFAVAGCSKKETAAESQPPEPTLDEEGLVAGEDVEPFETAAAPAWQGVWAIDKELCSIAPGAEDPAPIVLTDGEFIGYENRCRIALAEEGTEGGWTLELVCDAEGVEYVETIDVDVDGVTMRMTRADGTETVFQRCE